MATRFYFSSSASAPQSLGFANWAGTNSVAEMALLTEKLAGEALALGLRQATTVGSLRLDSQFVSPAITASGFINGVVDCQIAAREFQAGDNAVTAMAARIVTASGTVRGTLLAATKWFAPTSELINNATLRNMAFASGTTVASVTAAVGDRVVIEIGFGDDAGASPEFQARYGAPSAIADHGVNMTETTSLVPWIEFASNILFTLPATLQLAQLSEDLQLPPDFRASMLNKVTSDIGEMSDANAFGRFMILSESQAPISVAAGGVVHQCIEYLFTAAIRNRNGIDTIETSDALSRLLSKVLLDSLDISDSASLIEFLSSLLVLRSLSDSVDASDGMVKILSKTISESGFIADEFSKLLVKISQDSVDAVDIATTIKQAVRALMDNLDISDVFSKRLTKQAGDIGDILDTRSSGLFKSIGDSQLTTDSANKLLSKVLDDSTFLSDIVSTIRAALIALADSVVPFEEQQVKSLFKSVGDISDILDTRSSALSKALEDSQLTTDSVNKLLSKALGDSALLSDIVTTIRAAIVAFADSISFEEQQVKSLRKSVGDLGDILDNRSSLLSKSVGDQQDASDIAVLSAIVGLIFLAIADTLELSDAQRKALFKNVGDIESALDSTASLLSKSLSDRQDASDAHALTRIAVRAILDSLDTSDQFAKSLFKLLSESSEFADSFVKALTKVLGDNAEARDDFARQFAKAIGDSQGAQDLLSMALAKTITEQQEFSDSAALVLILKRALFDLVDLTDSADATRITNQLIREVIETQDVSDRFLKVLFKTLADNIDLVDAATLATVLGVPLVREYIVSMLADDGDLQAKELASRAGIVMVVDDNDPLDRQSGTKGRREK